MMETVRTIGDLRARVSAWRNVGGSVVLAPAMGEAGSLAAVDTFDPGVPARVFAAARLGKARLIDNLPVEKCE